MPHFDINKFDDHNKTDALAWWQRFLTEASCRTVPDDYLMKALYLQLIGGAQAWMNHLGATHTCTITELHTHLTWKEFEKLWFTRFMVRNVVKAAMSEVYTCSQGSMPTRDWTTNWQKLVNTPGFDLTFPNQRSEFFSRSCAGLRSALGNEYGYTLFQAILDRANLVIQRDDKAVNEKQSQLHYVAKQGYQRPAHNNVVISEETNDLHAAAASSSDGGIVAALPPKRPKRVRKNKATQETSSTGTRQQPWTAYKITKEVYDLRQRTLDQHIVHLRVVLDRLRLAKYQANLDKCKFAKQELEYLGHFVTPKGIRPLADKIQAIMDWPEPRCTTDVRSITGLAGYYQRFDESYSKVAAPLSRLQSPKVPFEFDDAARDAFATLKAAMQAAPALRIYDPTLPTQVTTDASGYGIGAVLEQCHEDGWHPVEYFSQKVPLVNTLDDARRKSYSQRESKTAKPQQGSKAPQIPRKRRTAMAAAAGYADSNMPGSPKRPVPPPVPVQRADEDALAFLERLQQYTETNATELRTWEKENAARREAIRLQQEAEQAARQQAAADSAAAARQQQQQLEASQTQARFQAAMNLLNEEAAYGRVLRQQHFRTTEEQEEPTEDERNRETTAVLIENLLYTCNWQQRELLAMRQVLIRHEGNFKAMDQQITALQADTSMLQAADSQQQAINDRLQDTVDAGMARLSAVESTGSAVSDRSPALATLAKQLDERINHSVASLGDISKFAGALTVSNQLQTLSDRVDH
ncbi:hypothetical protein CBR_g3375 [Chara braunii]|uniref:Reverse transcriptase/retrotransposon-derived protein RNase H-like domain-containing protein n=1 Tax=Chara braunii TaxID=69332 RepID=A0A388JQS0_CHABU|nr:hypothetical protein CBR_g3375 [Chara braunii]|eukprot:GBG60131.1 hypothetical protein CBR_g3375 [Chara braunii]